MPPRLSLADISEEKKKELITDLQNLLSGNETLAVIQDDEAYLWRFITACRFNAQKAYDKIGNYYDAMGRNREFFSTECVKDHIEVLEEDVLIALPFEDKEGRPVLLMKVGNMDGSFMELSDIVALSQVWVEYLHIDRGEKLGENGMTILVDVEGFPWSIFRWGSPHNIATVIKLIENYPVRRLRFHVINSNVVLTAAQKVIWTFLSEGVRQIVKFHPNPEDYTSLHEDISPDVLPTEYGGKVEYDYSELYSKLLEKNDVIASNLRTHILDLLP